MLSHVLPFYIATLPDSIPVKLVRGIIKTAAEHVMAFYLTRRFYFHHKNSKGIRYISQRTKNVKKQQG